MNRVWRRTTADALLGLVCLGASLAELELGDSWAPGTASHGAQLAEVVVVSVAFALARVCPWCAVGLFALGVMGVSALSSPPQLLALGLAMMYVGFRVGLGLTGWSLAAAALALAAAQAVRDLADPRMDGSDLAIDALFLTISVAAGAAIGRRQRRVERLTEMATDIADSAVRQERARIARELHDVVAHGLSVMVVQADAARHDVASDDPDTREALAVIERTGRECLREMRRLLAIVGDDHHEPDLEPQPGVRDVPELVRGFSRLGLPVDVVVEGEARPLPASADLAVYRIAQEALTNSLRHARGGRARVVIRFQHGQVEVEVCDQGGQPSVPSDGQGRGIAGMRERARLFGGSLDAAPADGGFRVLARLPTAWS